MSEFTLFIPKITPESRYVISGPDCQILTINVPPGGTIESEPGAMMYMHPAVKMNVAMGSCSRCCTGESCCKVTYTNTARHDAYVGITPSFPSKVIPIELSSVGNRMVLKGGSYISAINDVAINADFDCCSFASCFGGVGTLRQGATGSGTLFVEGGGTVMTKVLSPSEEIVVDSSSIVGFQSTVQLGLRLTGGFCTLCFGGEGCCYTTLTGPGLVVLESMPYSKWYAAVAPPPKQGDGGDGGGGGD